MAGDLIIPSVLDAAFQNFDTRFQQGFTGVQPWSGDVAMELPSATEEEVHAWLQMMPVVREWVGERTYNSLAANALRLKNRDYELSVAVPRNKFVDERFGLYAVMFQQMGFQFAKWPDRAFVSLLKNGTDATKAPCYDGKAFFATDHPVDLNDGSVGTINNYRAGTNLTAANFEAIYAAMAGFQREDGEVMGVLPDELWVPPALRSTAKLIAEMTLVPSTAGTATQSNPNAGTVRVRVIPELAGQDTTWYLAATAMPIKPLLFQLRQAPDFSIIAGPGSEHAKKRKEFLFGADARGAFAGTLPHLIIRCN